MEEQNRRPSASAFALALAAAAAASEECYFCKKPGHRQTDCKLYLEARQNCQSQSQSQTQKKQNKGKGRGKPYANSAKAASSSEASANNSGQNSSNNAAKRAEEFAGNANTSNTTPNFSYIPSSNWNADTGATSHMTPYRHWFVTYTPFRTPIRLANNHVVYSAGVGNVRF